MGLAAYIVVSAERYLYLYRLISQALKDYGVPEDRVLEEPIAERLEDGLISFSGAFKYLSGKQENEENEEKEGKEGREEKEKVAGFHHSSRAFQKLLYRYNRVTSWSVYISEIVQKERTCQGARKK